MNAYLVEFAINIDAESREEACKKAWELMTWPGAMLPVGTVTDSDGQENIDLQEISERNK